VRTFALDKYNIPALVADCQFCDGDRRLAFRLHDGEHGYEDLIFVDPTSGAILELVEQPADWLVKQPRGDRPEDWDDPEKTAEPYRGEIIVCRDGARLFQRTVDRRGWQWRDRTPDGWRDGPTVSTRLYEEEEDRRRREWVSASMYTTLAVSADGGTAVLSGLLFGERVRGRGGELYVRTFQAEIWSVAPDGAVTPRKPIAPVDASGRKPLVAVSSGSRPLVAICCDGRTSVRGLSGRKVADLKVPWTPDDSRGNPKYHVRFSEDGSRLVVLFDDTVTAWDTANWTAAAIKIPEPAPLCMAVSARGDTVVIAGRDGVVRFFDAATGSPGTVIVPPLPTDPKPGNDVPTTLCFSRDGTMCVLASLWGAVAIWDVD
jgi:hypothetical protein